MALCDPDADLRCGTLDCSEPDHRPLQPEEVPWDALEQSVFGVAGAHTRVRSVKEVKDMQVGRCAALRAGRHLRRRCDAACGVASLSRRTVWVDPR